MKKTVVTFCVLLAGLMITGCENNGVLDSVEDVNVSIDEYPAAGTFLDSITVAGYEGEISYSVKSSSPEGAFAVDTSGVLTVADASLYDYETNTVITGVVTLECEGDEKDVNVTVNINDTEVFYAGIRDTTGMYTGSFSRNYLLGTRHTLPGGGVLQSINLIGNNTGAGVQMAIYADNNGVPGTLVAVSATGTVGEGEISLAVTSIDIAAGKYWIMAVYSATGNHTYKLSEEDNPIYYTSLTYGSEIPTDASSFITYNGGDFAYSVTVSE